MAKLEGGKIANYQLGFLVLGFLFGSSIIINPAEMIGRDAWLAVLLGMLEGLLFLGVTLSLAARFRGQTLVQINEAIFGSYVGKVISGAYLWYFLHLGSLVLRTFGDFFTTVIYLETPIIVFLLLLALICASAVRNGLEVIVRCSIILVLMSISTVFLDTLLLTKEMKLFNLLPVLDVDWARFFETSHGMGTFPFGETVSILMIMAFSNNQRKAGSAIFWAMIVGGLLLSVIVARNTSVLGATACIQTYPVFPAIRLINIGELFTRMEIIVAINLVTLGFIKIVVLYYGTVLGVAQVMRLRSYLPVVLPVGALMVALSVLDAESNIELFDFTFKIYPYYSLPFQIFLPLLSLFVALIRGLPKEGGRQEDGDGDERGLCPGDETGTEPRSEGEAGQGLSPEGEVGRWF